MKDVIDQQRCGRDRVVWWRRVGVGLLALLSLKKDIDSVLQLGEPCSLLVDVLSSGFGMLRDCLAPLDGLLFLLETLYFLLDFDQFLLCSGFDFLSFLISALYLELIEL
jgi:hypothetical protein